MSIRIAASLAIAVLALSGCAGEPTGKISGQIDWAVQEIELLTSTGAADCTVRQFLASQRTPVPARIEVSRSYNLHINCTAPGYEGKLEVHTMPGCNETGYSEDNAMCFYSVRYPERVVVEMQPVEAQ